MFDKDNDVSKIQTEEFNLPLVNAKDGDNGIMYYGRECDFESAENTIDIINDGAVSTGNVYSQPQKTGVLYNAYLIKPFFLVNRSVLHFFTCAIKKSIKLKFGYENKAGWAKVREEMIFLPITKDRSIDFDFIEEFIAELEEWLRAAGFEDCTLTEEELNAISEIEDDHLKWAEKEIVDDIFTVQNTHNILKENVVFRSGETPYVTASEGNNSIVSYISYKDEMKEEGNNILIGGKTLVITYQPNDFFSNDSHNLVLKPIAKAAKREDVQLFLTTSLYKSLSPKYSWGDSISKKKIKKDSLTLPVNSQGVPDYSKMATIISAVKKLVIKDVAEYANKKIRVAQQVIAK